MRRGTRDDSGEEQGLADGMYLFCDRCRGLIRQVREEAYEESAQGERRRKYAKRFHLLAAWKYGIMMAPERLNWERPKVRRGYTSSRSGY